MKLLRPVVLFIALTIGFGTTFLPATARADISRTEILDRAKAFVYYPWHSSASNLTASCVPDYNSAYVVGDFVGVAYDWGGFDSLFQYSQKLSQGYGAGTPAFGDVYSCTTGVDCSGFVSRAWHTAWKYGTWTLPDTSVEIPAINLLPGDSFNDSGYHCTMYSHMMANGEPFMYEAVNFNTHVNVTGGWSYVDGFKSIRFDNVSGTTVSNPLGTLNNPIPVSSFPYSDSRNTIQATSDLLDGCGASPNTNESGREYIYAVEITQPGTITVSVSDDASSDIDVHLYTSWNTSDCVARHDSTFSKQVDCGTYLVVADTYRSSGGTEYPGNYDLTITMSPSGAGCGAGVPTYDPMGELGDACSYPNNNNLPFCNPTHAAEVCLYTSTDSFCSKSCGTNTDCNVMPGGGCCEDIGDGSFYCLTADLCSTPPDDPGDPPDDGNPPEPPGDPSDPGDTPDDDNPDDPNTPSGPGWGDTGSGCSVGSNQPAHAAPFLLALLIGFRRRRF